MKCVWNRVAALNMIVENARIDQSMPAGDIVKYCEHVRKTIDFFKMQGMRDCTAKIEVEGGYMR